MKRISGSWYAMAALAAVAFLLCAPELLRGSAVVYGEIDLDMWSYFYWVRDWGFRELRQGNLPLWNPHIFCGVPFFGNFQSALLYPPNWLFLVLPTAIAHNWSMALHVFLAGALAYAWCRGRGVDVIDALAGGFIYMLCGAYFYKIGVGWPTFVQAAAWAPLIFLSLDRIFDTRQWRWSMLGGLAVAMQVLCGSPQYAYNTALAAGFYFLLNFWHFREHWRRIIPAAALIYVLGAGLCMVQILPGLDLARESTRAGGMQDLNATVGSFPPAAFLSLLSPYVFGPRNVTLIDGGIRWLLLNIGAAGLALAVWGAWAAERRSRRFSITVAVLFCILAMGQHSPLYWLFLDYVPGFRLFRVPSRLLVQTSLFLAMLAALGLREVRKPDGRPARAAIFPAMAGLLALSLGVAAWSARHSPTGGAWNAILQAIGLPGLRYVWHITNAEVLTTFQRVQWSAVSLLIGAAFFLATAACLVSLRRFRWMAWGLVGLILLELGIAARMSLASLSLPIPGPLVWQKAIASLPAGERTWHGKPAYADRAMLYNTLEANGYEGAVLSRFDQFVSALARGASTSSLDAKQAILNYPRIAEMLRIRTILARRPQRAVRVRRPPMRQFELISQCQVFPTRAGLFQAMMSPAFEPRKSVLLESEPSIRPAADATGRVRLIQQTTDEIELKVSAAKPVILLITDTYSAGWQAAAQRGSAQKDYQIMPANGLLRAIPLTAGRHHLILRYRPRYYRLGAGVSIATAGAYALAGLAGAIIHVRRRLQ